MAKRKERKIHAVRWFLHGRKREKPFASSTVAESAGIREMLSIYGDLRIIPRDTLFNPNQWFIVDTYIKSGQYTPRIL